MDYLTTCMRSANGASRIVIGGDDASLGRIGICISIVPSLQYGPLYSIQYLHRIIRYLGRYLTSVPDEPGRHLATHDCR